MWVLGLAAAVGLLGRPLADALRGRPLAVPFFSRVQVPELDAAGVGHTAAGYDLRIADPTIGQRLLDLVPSLLVVAVIIGIVVAVLRFLRTVANGDPFAPGQVARLRLIAGLLLLGTPLAVAAHLVANALILARLDLGGLPPATLLLFPWLPLLLGLCVALIAEAFKTGAQMREDVEGLV